MRNRNKREATACLPRTLHCRQLSQALGLLPHWSWTLLDFFVYRCIPPRNTVCVVPRRLPRMNLLDCGHYRDLTQREGWLAPVASGTFQSAAEGVRRWGRVGNGVATRSCGRPCTYMLYSFRVSCSLFFFVHSHSSFFFFFFYVTVTKIKLWILCQLQRCIVKRLS